MSNKYNIVGSDGNLHDPLLEDIEIYNASGSLKRIKEGDLFTSSTGDILPILRDTQLHIGVVDNNDQTFTLKYFIDTNTLANAKSIVIIGDSYGEGYGTSSPDKIPELFIDYISTAAPDATVTNLAKFNYVTPQWCPDGDNSNVDTARNITKAISYNPDIIILISALSNDFYSGNAISTVLTESQVISNLTKIRDEAYKYGIPILFTSTSPRTQYDKADQLKLVSLFEAEKEAFPYILIDQFNPLRDTSDITNNPAKLKSEYDLDTVHLTAAGTAIYETSIEEVFSRYFVANTVYTSFTLEVSDDGENFTTLDTNSDVKKSFTTQDSNLHYYRVKGKYKNNAESQYSNVVSLQQTTTTNQALFNFNATAQSIPDTVDVSGTPSSSVVTVTDPTTGWQISSIETVAWVVYGPTTSSNTNGSQSDDGGGYPFTEGVTHSSWYTFATNSSTTTIKRKLAISNLDNSKTYKLEILSSIDPSAGAPSGESTEFHINEITESSKYVSVDSNTSNLVIYTGISPISGSIYIDMNNDNGQFAIINGLKITEE